VGTSYRFGLALSGGGFRAAGFHLGVLKRLRELELLQKVDVISTVSGGSITGAYWVWWQAVRGDTLNSDDEWNRFEGSLIAFMRRGFRGRAMLLALYLPTIVLWTFAALVMWWLGSLSLARLFVAGTASAGIAYVLWHYSCSRLLERAYDQHLFGGATMESLKLGATATGVARSWPRLMVNCTALNTGHPLIFTHDHPTPEPALREGAAPSIRSIHHVIRTQDLLRRREPVSMARDTPIAKAVAASSCFPGGFTPLKLVVSGQLAHWLGGHWYERGRVPYAIRLIDGGVFDNQGTYCLVGKCQALIVSDASAVLRDEMRPSSWQVFPFGKGVVFRSQDIIYERMRALGERRLEGTYQIGARTDSQVRGRESDQPEADQSLQGCKYLQLRHSFPDIGTPCLSELLMDYVARIRTDLDRFSSIEISILLFHGYSVVDQALHRGAVWYGRRQRKSSFHSADPHTDIAWETISTSRNWPDDAATAAKQREILRHIEPSDSRSSIWRALRRLRNRWRSVGYFWDEAIKMPRAVKRAVVREQRRAEQRH
jgi:predicted acylesterase/phospholipase RssA